jgi:capsular exopolysaccharide synthesis family protein
MGRIDDALKRAATMGVHAPGADPLERRSVATLQSATTIEDYPAEEQPAPAKNARRAARAKRPAPKSPVVPNQVAAPERRPAPPPQAAPQRPAATSRSATPTITVRASDAVAGKLVSDSATPNASVEQYRRLAAALHEMQSQHSIKTVMVSSAVPGEGKTLTATNLALTLSHSYRRRVMLIDADLRRPGVHQVFRIPNEMGLGDGLRDEATALRVTEVSERLTVLPAGRPDSNPTAGLTSDRMRAILQEAASRFDWVILDSPPIGLMADAKLMSSLVDGVLLIVGAGSTDYQLAQSAIAEVGRERIIGTVLNRVIGETAAPARSLEDYYTNKPAGR